MCSYEQLGCEQFGEGFSFHSKQMYLLEEWSQWLEEDERWLNEEEE